MKPMKHVLLLALLLAMGNAGIAAESATWGPAHGIQVSIEAVDQDGANRTLRSLSGSKGLLIFFNRSADW